MPMLGRRRPLSIFGRMADEIGDLPGLLNPLRGSVQAVDAGSEEFQEVEVAEDLELLADFVGDVGVFGMEFG